MTTEEARCMAEVAVDGCSVCARNHIRRLVLAFPAHQQAILDVWLAGLDAGEREYESAEMLADIAEEKGR
ncbi:hypothetical protein LCGC14_1751000 [marine sediment metagenome]|uniref:Uncharacterized protein n=1 Tax=marine sediment metagenome TaxID=412755 RepID=A0A0F9JIZ0_9ZZZZ